jgi:hypothetical protein
VISGLQPGELVDGRFRVVGELGSGGMAVVYRAQDLQRGVDVALKLLHPEDAGNPEALARFQREAELAASVDRFAGIVRVHAAGAHGASPYFAMDLVEGQDMEAWLRQEERSPREVVELLLRVARSVGCCHEAGVVHRDLKPANVLIDAEGRPRVTDFGIALGDGAQRLTRTGQMVGTPDTMAPEQVADGSRATAPSVDVYALGAILYRGLTGRYPHTGRSLLELLAKIAAGKVAPPSSLTGGVSPALEAICLRALAKAPAERHPNAAALAADLEGYLAGEGVPAQQGATRRAGFAIAAVAALIALPLAAAALAHLERQRGRDALAAAERWDTETLASYGLGLGAAPDSPPDGAEVEAQIDRLEALLGQLQGTEQQLAERLLARVKTHAALARRLAAPAASSKPDASPPAETGWERAARARALAHDGALAAALELLAARSPEESAELPGLAAFEASLATDLLVLALDGAFTEQAEQTREHVALAARALGERSIALRRGALEAQAHRWGEAFAAASRAGQARERGARLAAITRPAPAVVPGPALAAALDAALQRQIARAEARPGAGRLLPLTLDDALLRADPSRGVGDDLRFFVGRLLTGDPPPEVLLAVLRAGIQVEEHWIRTGMDDAALKGFEEERPRSRALAFVRAMRLYELSRRQGEERFSQRLPRLRTTLAAFRVVVGGRGPEGDLVPDLALRYQIFARLRLAQVLIQVARRQPPDSPLWAEGFAALAECESGEEENLFRMRELVQLRGRLTHGSQGFDAAKRVWEDGLNELWARMKATPRLSQDSQNWRSVVHGFISLGEFLLEGDRHQAALNAGRSALSAAPASRPEFARDARQFLARTYLEMGDPAAAEEVIAPALPDGLEQAQVAAMAVRVALANDEPDRAAALLRSALEHNPGSQSLLDAQRELRRARRPPGQR